MLSFMSTISLISTIYSALTFKSTPGTVQKLPKSLKSTSFIIQLLVTISMVVGYGVVVAMVDNEAVKVFSPHEILDIAVGSNSSAVKKA